MESEQKQLAPAQAHTGVKHFENPVAGFGDEASASQRLARELHDGVLQSLGGIALQLRAAQALVHSDPLGALHRLRDIERMIQDEQRDLRFLVDDVRLDAAPVTSLRDALAGVARRVAEIWDVRVEVAESAGEPDVPEGRRHEILRLAREGVVNAARHANATYVRVAVGACDGDLVLEIADDGHGFPFHGDFAHAALAAQRIGPVMLKERVEALGGTLAISSSPAGARVRIAVPIVPA